MAVNTLLSNARGIDAFTLAADRFSAAVRHLFDALIAPGGSGFVGLSIELMGGGGGGGGGGGEGEGDDGNGDGDGGGDGEEELEPDEPEDGFEEKDPSPPDDEDEPTHEPPDEPPDDGEGVPGDDFFEHVKEPGWGEWKPGGPGPGPIPGF